MGREFVISLSADWRMECTFYPHSFLSLTFNDSLSFILFGPHFMEIKKYKKGVGLEDI